MWCFCSWTVSLGDNRSILPSDMYEGDLFFNQDLNYDCYITPKTSSGVRWNDFHLMIFSLMIILLWYTARWADSILWSHSLDNLLIRPSSLNLLTTDHGSSGLLRVHRTISSLDRTKYHQNSLSWLDRFPRIKTIYPNFSGLHYKCLKTCYNNHWMIPTC